MVEVYLLQIALHLPLLAPLLLPTSGVILGKIKITTDNSASSFLCRFVIMSLQLLHKYPVCNCETSTAISFTRFAISEVRVSKKGCEF